MAILWAKQAGGVTYQVRSAGRTRRLYANGVLHSQYNPANPVTGHVWDLLMVPAFFHPPGSARRILVLGVGGGAVIGLLGRFVAPGALVGVELNPQHLFVARRFFGVAQQAVHLVQADARTWIQHYAGPPFHMIIDDLFGEQDGQPVRAVEMNVSWFECLLKHLDRHGMIVANFTSVQELGRCAYFTSQRLARRFAGAFQLTTPADENAVGAFLRRGSSTHTLRANLRATPGLNPDLKTSRLRYRVRTVTMDTT